MSSGKVTASKLKAHHKKGKADTVLRGLQLG